MKKRRIRSVSHLLLLFTVIMIPQLVIAFLYNKTVFIVDLIITVALIVYTMVRMEGFYKYIYDFVHKVGADIEGEDRILLQNLKAPVLIVSPEGEMIWYNNAFRSGVIASGDVIGGIVTDLFTDAVLSELKENGEADFEYGGRSYLVYSTEIGGRKNSLSLYYFIDETELKSIKKEYELSRPVVGIAYIDNLDEVLSNARESERAAIIGEIEILIEKWLSSTNGFIRRLNDGRFLLVVEERDLKKFKNDKFPVLEWVRKLEINGKTGATLSVGFGCGCSEMQRCEELARQALDMALGRGGDQIAVKRPDDFTFYGGVSKGVERRSKVRTRVISSALKELILASDNVIIMGHRFGDLDSFGSSFGLWKLVKHLKKNAYIVTDIDKSLARPLISFVEQNGFEDAVVSESSVMSMITKKTLLIITDTHCKEFLEFPEIYKKCKSVVVIDHHRKSVDYIDNAVIFYHEHFASSACEMVTELIQYMGVNIIDKVAANALLSGIMLDTKNFVIKTGVRTFEAAGYLRGRGADPVDVKKFFAGSILSYKTRASVVSSAEIYSNCAISFIDKEYDDIRIIASQAADELLNISDVKASFVIYPVGDVMSISARSFGDMNVQIIMEQMGGGGHLTMAATQLKGSSIESARTGLCEAIDAYVSQQ